MADESTDKTADSAYDDTALPDGEPMPPVDFTTFILSLSTSALISLGEAQDEAGNRHVDLSLSRQTIDILGLLHDKTKGNLSGEEERLLDRVLLDLRLKFVDAVNKKKKKG